jgi:hypothetical protein
MQGLHNGHEELRFRSSKNFETVVSFVRDQWSEMTAGFNYSGADDCFGSRKCTTQSLSE